MSRQNYYAQRKRRRRQAVDAELIATLVQRERRIQPRVGTRKLYKMLQQELGIAGVKVGRDRFFEILAKRPFRGRRSTRRPSELCSAQAGQVSGVYITP